MKRAMIVVLLTLVALGFPLAAFGQFAGYDWGTTRQAIVQAEGLPATTTDYYVSYKMDDQESMVFYFLNDGRLAHGRFIYMFRDYYDLQAYNKGMELVDILTGLYGEPEFNELFWDDSATDAQRRLYATPPEAIRRDVADWAAGWRTPETNIMLIIEGAPQDDLIWIVVQYDSRELIETFDAEQQRRSQGRF